MGKKVGAEGGMKCKLISLRLSCVKKTNLPVLSLLSSVPILRHNLPTKNQIFSFLVGKGQKPGFDANGPEKKSFPGINRSG